MTTPQQGKPEDAAKFLVHSGALIKPACAALTSKHPRLCILGMQARPSGCDEPPRTHAALQLVVHLTNASALLPSHCLAVAPVLKDARDGLDESGSLKFVQLLSALCLLPAFVSQSQCSAAGEAAHAARSFSGACVEPAAAALSMLLPLHKDRNPVISQTAAAIAVMAVQSVIDVASSSGDTSAALSLIGKQHARIVYAPLVSHAAQATALFSSSTKCISRCSMHHERRRGVLTLVVQVPKWLAVKDMPTSLSLELLHAALQCQPDMIKQAPQLLQVRMRDASRVSCVTLPLQVVQSRVCPVLQSMMLKPPPFAVCIRCLRLVSRCIVFPYQRSAASFLRRVTVPSPHASPAASSCFTV